MKNKKIIMYIGIVLGLFLIIFLGILVSKNNKTETEEITPQEEITDTQLRQTLVSLYFMDNKTGELVPEARQIDAKKLLENPYKELINMLIEGPKNEQLTAIIPRDTGLNNVEIENGIVYIDFSEDFIKEQNLGESQEKMIVKSILKTLVELSEVDGIKILINGKENESFPDECVNFKNIFYMEKS